MNSPEIRSSNFIWRYFIFSLHSLGKKILSINLFITVVEPIKNAAIPDSEVTVIEIPACFIAFATRSSVHKFGSDLDKLSISKKKKDNF